MNKLEEHDYNQGVNPRRAYALKAPEDDPAMSLLAIIITNERHIELHKGLTSSARVRKDGENE
jgi:hypothetical protein